MVNGSEIMFIDFKKLRIPLVLLLIFILLFYLFGSGRLLRSFYPYSYRSTIEHYATENDLDPLLVAALIRVESKYDHKAQSSPGARGLMQVMPDTGQWVAEKIGLKEFDPDDLYDPEINIQIGCWYIAHLTNSFDGDMLVALAAYNAGRGNTQKWLGQKIWDGKEETISQIPFGETRHFLRKVKRDYSIYRKLYSNMKEK
jgi:soluble lytic murein transglycosylase